MRHKGKFTPADAEGAGYNLTIWRAVQVAGGEAHVARELSKAKTTVRYWMRTGSVPEQYRQRLCELGGDTFKPEQLNGRQGASA